jgi:hypothetical protein
MRYAFVNPPMDRHIHFLRSDFFVSEPFGVTGFRSNRLDTDMSHSPIQYDHSSVQLEPEDDEFHNWPDQEARDNGHVYQNYGNFHCKPESTLVYRLFIFRYLRLFLYPRDNLTYLYDSDVSPDRDISVTPDSPV